MAVHAHPDDESSKGAAVSAKYAAEGVEVLVVSCTGGERGDILNPKLAHDQSVLENMSQVRQAEMAAAASALGVQHRWLGFVDSGLPEGDPLPPLPEGSFATLPVEVAGLPLVKLIREFRPQVMTTYDENGGYPHPDHIMTHKVSAWAFDVAADPDAYPELGPAWEVSKLYYNHGFSFGRLNTLNDALVEATGESPFTEWLTSWDSGDREPDREFTTQIECSEYFEARDNALRAHATQIDPDGFFFAMPRELEKSVWPWEEFELAVSRVPVEIPETDLFAGLRP